MEPDDLLCSRNSRPQNDSREQAGRSSCSLRTIKMCSSDARSEEQSAYSLWGTFAPSRTERPTGSEKRLSNVCWIMKVYYLIYSTCLTQRAPRMRRGMTYRCPMRTSLDTTVKISTGTKLASMSNKEMLSKSCSISAHCLFCKGRPERERRSSSLLLFTSWLRHRKSDAFF